MLTPAQARLLFPGTQGCIYLENSARGLLPLVARDAAMRYYDARIAGEAKETGLVFTESENARGEFAALIGATADEVTLTRNVTDGLNILVTAIDWRRGDNAVVSREVEHPNGVYALYNMRDRHGVDVRMVEPADDLSISVDGIAAAIDAKTRLVIVSSVTFSTGARTDLEKLGALCRARGVTLLVDGAQSVGALELNVGNAKIDALAVGASKYLCGPYGLGFLYVRRELAESLRPTYLGRFAVDLGDAHEGEQGGGEYRLMPGARRFDSGSYNFGSAGAAVASLKILRELGLPAIERHVLHLSAMLDHGFRALGIPVLSGGNDAHRSHLVIVGLRQATAADRARFVSLAEFLAARGIRVSQRQGRLRFSFHFYNTEDEVCSVLDETREWLRSGGQ